VLDVAHCCNSLCSGRHDLDVWPFLKMANGRLLPAKVLES